MKALWLSVVVALTALPTPGNGEPLFGREGDPYGVEPNALTFTTFGGVYLNGLDQQLTDSQSKQTKIWDFGLRFGWAFHKYFEMESSLGFTPTRTSTSRQNVFYYTFDGLGQYPVTDWAVPYVDLGFGEAIFRVESGQETHKFALDYGAGAKFFVARNLALRPDIRMLTTFAGGHTAFLITLNLTYYAAPWAKKKAVIVEAPSAPPPAPIPATLPAAAPEPVSTPTPDRDHDGVADDRDKCPDQPERVNGYKDEDGCPDREIDEFQGVITEVNFTSGTSVLTRSSYDKLDRFAAMLKKFKELRVKISGHSDSTGSKALNMRLSQQRAESVQEYLVHAGVDRNRLVTEGFGPTKPISSNKTVEGRAQNRRVEFTFLNPQVLPLE